MKFGPQMPINRIMKTALFLFLSLFASIAFSQDEGAINTKPLKASMAPLTLLEGRTTAVNIQISLDAPYHAYADKFALKVLQPAGVEVKNIRVTPIITFIDPSTKKEKQGVTGNAQLSADLTAVN